MGYRSILCVCLGQDAAKQNVKCERFVNLKSNDEIRVLNTERWKKKPP